MKFFLKKITPPFLLDSYHFLWALFGALFYRFPSFPRQNRSLSARKLKVIGVTGTNGKTTVVELITRILKEAGYRVATLSSIRFEVGKKERENRLRMTMPGRGFLQKFLREAVNAGCQYAVLEVTSEGIKQHRHRFINFDVAVFTNLSPEHIEAHGSFEKYKRAKGKLFEATKNIQIVNLDDENANYFLSFPAKEKWVFGLKSRVKNEKLKIQLVRIKNLKMLEVQDYQVLPQGLNFLINDIEFNLKLLGKFNIYNSLAAICVGLSQRIDLETCKRALEKIEGLPGRMELVISEPFLVFVDYAFTPNALKQVYQAINSKFKRQRAKVICVLGACGGGRDKWKRPVLGEIAAKYCNEVIVTNEDPYDEDPMEIINQVASGAKGRAKKILDRREAIREALKIAKKDDVVVITGKGCEPSICVAGGKQIPWDDRKVVREEFKQLSDNLL